MDLILNSRSSNLGDSDSDVLPMIFESSTYFRVQLQVAERLSLVSGIEQGRRKKMGCHHQNSNSHSIHLVLTILHTHNKPGLSLVITA